MESMRRAISLWLQTTSQASDAQPLTLSLDSGIAALLGALIGGSAAVVAPLLLAARERKLVLKLEQRDTLIRMHELIGNYILLSLQGKHAAAMAIDVEIHALMTRLDLLCASRDHGIVSVAMRAFISIDSALPDHQAAAAGTQAAFISTSSAWYRGKVSGSQAVRFFEDTLRHNVHVDPLQTDIT